MSSSSEDLSEYRLPRRAVPTRYALRMAPDLSGGTFQGEVAIELALLEPASEIVLNAAGLSLETATLREAPAGGEPCPLGIALDAERERVVFSASQERPPGDYVLWCSFSGSLDQPLRGFYRSAFTDEQGVQRALCSTHFEATDARRAFPCFDEPDLKAVFSVTLDVPEGLAAFSNSPEKEVVPLEHGRRVTFEDTIIISTYVVCFVIGPFETTEPVVVGDVSLRVVATPGNLHLASFALKAAAHSVSWFEDYFAIAYPGSKLDLVALPEFAMGAMENLGCITFREAYLLCDEENSSIAELSRIAEVVAHEIAHMWFGDLVTMRWWNGIWLNEAFATFMATKAMDSFRPEWHLWVTFGMEKNLALSVDGLHSTRPIEFPVRSPEEADAMFDDLTYLKGGNVLRMVEQYLGEDGFRDGVRQYLADHACSNAETTDLWDSIEAESAGEPVRAVLESWIFQGGHPVVTAAEEGKKLHLSTEPFSYMPSALRPRGAPPSAIGEKWLVPVLFEERPGKVASVLLGPEPLGAERVELPVGDGLPVVNAGGSGTYRVRYESPLFERLLSKLAQLEPLERFNLVADTWACTLARLLPLQSFLSLLGALHEEAEPNIWAEVSAAMGIFAYAADGTAAPELAAFVRSIGGRQLARLGLGERESDTAEDLRTRAILLRLMGTIGDDSAVRSKVREIFLAGRTERGKVQLTMPASIATAVLHVLVYSGGREEFELVREGYRNPTDPVSERRHLFALAATRDPDLVSEVLAMCAREIRRQDVHLVIRTLIASRQAGPQAWRYTVDNFGELSARLPPHAMTTIFGAVSYLLQLDENGKVRYLEEARRFADEHDFGGRRRLVEQSLERQAVNARFVEAVHPSLATELRA